jgi:hypothetical protein
MRIIGCDLHARQQTVAMLDTACQPGIRLRVLPFKLEIRSCFQINVARRESLVRSGEVEFCDRLCRWPSIRSFRMLVCHENVTAVAAIRDNCEPKVNKLEKLTRPVSS